MNLSDERLLYGGLEGTVLDAGDLDAGEEILNDTHEEWHIFGEELGRVGVTQRTDQHDILTEVRVTAFQGT